MLAKKGFAGIVILIVIAAIAASFGLGYFLGKNPSIVKPLNSLSSKEVSSKLKFDKEPVKLDPFGDKGGPYFHQIYMAKSPDGLNFQKEDGLLFDKASVPDIIRLASGRIFIYAVDGAQRSKSGVMVAISDDDGRTWQQGSIQLKTETGVGGGADPEVVLLPDGRLRLYYLNFSGKPDPQRGFNPESKNSVHSAISTDGVNFEEEGGKRFEYAQITDPDVVQIGDKWFMYLAQGPKLIAASSDDGLNFRQEKTIRQKGSVSNTVGIEENLWRQFYCDMGIKSALSTDGLNFQEEEGFRLTADQGKVICDPAPVKIDNGWLMVYKVAEGKQPPNQPPPNPNPR